MTVGQLRAILEAEWIPDDLVISDYNENQIDDVNIVIDKDARVSDIRFAMSAP